MSSPSEHHPPELPPASRKGECFRTYAVEPPYAVGKIYMQCDKVRVIVAWGKNCREESGKVFAIGYQVCKGTCRVLTVIQLT